MRFISQYGNFSIQIFPEEYEMVQTRHGFKKEITSKCLIAHFDVGGITELEVEQAIENFGRIRGVPDNVPVSTRLSFYDTDKEAFHNKWTPEFKEKVEQSLLEKMGRGQHYFIPVERPPEKPFPSYDEIEDPSEIVYLARRSGFGVNGVLEYEQANKNRPEVIEAVRVAREDEVVVGT